MGSGRKEVLAGASKPLEINSWTHLGKGARKGEKNTGEKRKRGTTKTNYVELLKIFAGRDRKRKEGFSPKKSGGGGGGIFEGSHFY